MEMIVFEIRGDFAYFRIPEGTRSSYSFPFPPRTAVFGIIAGILGREENLYWEEDSDFSSIKIGLEILSVPSLFPIKMNYWRTKSIIEIGPRKLDYKLMLPHDVGGKHGRGFTTQVKLNYFCNVHFRIYLKIDDAKLANEITQRLIEKKYFRPPFLGHANLLAEITYIGSFKAKEIENGDFHSICYGQTVKQNSLDLLYLGASGFTIYNGVPVKYELEKMKTKTIEFWKNIPSEYGTVFVPDIQSTIPLSVISGTGYELLINSNIKHISIV